MTGGVEICLIPGCDGLAPLDIGEDGRDESVVSGVGEIGS
jgi:hypothetical protein